MKHRRREIIDRDPVTDRPMIKCVTCGNWRPHSAHEQCGACYMASRREDDQLFQFRDGVSGPRLVPPECEHNSAAFKSFSIIWSSLYKLGVSSDDQEQLYEIIRENLKSVRRTGNGVEIAQAITLPRPTLVDSDEQTPRHRKERQKKFEAFGKIWTGLIQLGVRQPQRQAFFRIIRPRLGSLADDFVGDSVQSQS